jgi:hypothetical protein
MSKSTPAADMSDPDPTPISPATFASISIREYIYLLPYPLPQNTPIPYTPNLPSTNPLNLPTTLFEPTSTLVLTSPRKTFVDLRFFKPRDAGESELPNRGDERDRLEWGFAGSSASKPIADPHGAWEGTTYSRWTQFVDSRFPVGSDDIPIDEGIMYPIDAERTLEFGHMYHPSVKEVRSHEEMWFDPAVTSTSRDGKKRCVVLRCCDDVGGVRGVVVRLGKWCQGVVKVGNGGVTCERWEWEGTGGISQDGGADKGDDGEEADQWKRVARIGELMVPCGVAFRHEVLQMGGRIKYGEYEWVVEEVWEWE